MNKIITIFFLSFLSVSVFGQEICNNGIDDDGDGLIDMNDPDCSCPPTAIPSLIPNPSFEQHTCCPTGYSQMSCATGWAQATSATTDYFNCSFQFQAAVSAGISPTDGTGMTGTIISNGWQEYLGSCLNSPLLAGQSYTIQFSVASTPITGTGGICNGGTPTYGAINLTLFGNASCVGFPLGGVTGCPPGFTPIGTVSYTPAPSWSTVTMTFTPTFNVNSVILGSPCTLPAGYNGTGSAPNCYAYFYWDNLILNSSNLFNAPITQTGQWCNNNIQLTTPSVAGATYQWYLNGVALAGETSTTLNVSTGGYGAGDYLFVANNAGGCYTGTSTVTAPPMPNSAIVAVPGYCAGSTVPFTDNSSLSSGTITSWAWDFGDGNTSTQQNPSNTYATAGSYTVSLTVTSDQNCTSTSTQVVTINPNPVSSFTFSSANPAGSSVYCSGDVVNFTDGSTISSGSITSWAWDFGDGNTSTVQNPSNTYTSAGTYTVTLTTTSNNGCTNTTTNTVTINPTPVAGFTTPNNCANLPSVFTDASSVGTGTIVSWGWDFGDASGTSTQQNPTYSYATDGSYNVTLIVVSDQGCVDTVIQPVQKFNIPFATYNVVGACIGDTTCFTDLSTSTPDPISTYSWDFGNGNTSSLQNPCEVFSGSPNSVLLTVTTSNGCTDDTLVTFNLDQKPVPDFSFDTVCVGGSTQFTDLTNFGSAQPGGYTWNFGDGNISAQQNPMNSYSSGGSYSVTLVASTVSGCSDSVNHSVFVESSPVANFTVSDTVGCSPLCVVFTSTSVLNGTSASYVWNFTNGDTSTLASDTVCLSNSSTTQSGYLGASLLVTNAQGCVDSLSVDSLVRIYPAVVAEFSENITLTLVDFLNQSQNANSYLWNFGDSTTSVEIDPSHDFIVGGDFNVMLIATSVDGCIDTVMHTVHPVGESVLIVPNVFTPNADGSNDIFKVISDYLLEVHMVIYDRWGLKLAERDGISNGWDGRTAAGEMSPSGTYYYLIEAKGMDGKDYSFQGNFSLIR